LGANLASNALDIIDPDSGRLIDSVPVGKWPQYIINSPDGKRVYVSNWGSGDVSVVDLGMRSVIVTIPVGVNPLGMTITSDSHKLYVAVTAQALEHVEGELPCKVVVVDTTTYTIVKETRPGVAPRFVNISPDETRVYVNDYRGRINIIDTSSDRLVDSILLTPPTTYMPGDIAITPDDAKILVYANGIHQVLAIDTVTHALLARFDAFSSAIAISSDGRRAYIPGFRFTVIDLLSLTADYVEMPDIGGGGHKIVLSKDERIAYIADAPRDLLQVVDLENWRLMTNIPVGDMGDPEFGLAITPDGSEVFVCNGYSKDVSVVSTSENRVIDTIPMESAPAGIGISPDGTVAYVIEVQSDVRGFTHVVAIDIGTRRVIQRWSHEPVGFGNPWEVVVSPDGQNAYFGGVDGEIVVVLDIAAGVTRYIDVGLDPFNLALGEDGRLLFVSNANSDDITIIDTQTETVVGKIPIQIEGIGFIYATIADSRGKLVELPVNFVAYDRGIQGTFESVGFAFRHPRLDGCWIPISEGDYMLWIDANREDTRFVSQIYKGISDFERRAEAPRVRVTESQVTSVNFVLQDGHHVSGILVDRDDNPVSAGGSIVNAQTRASICGCIGFGSDRNGRFLVNVPDGMFDLYFDGILVAGKISVYKDVDLGKAILGPSEATPTVPVPYDIGPFGREVAVILGIAAALLGVLVLVRRRRCPRDSSVSRKPASAGEKSRVSFGSSISGLSHHESGLREDSVDSPFD
jgi:YVTN family beta-propeller protein